MIQHQRTELLDSERKDFSAIAEMSSRWSRLTKAATSSNKVQGNQEN